MNKSQRNRVAAVERDWRAVFRVTIELLAAGAVGARIGHDLKRIGRGGDRFGTPWAAGGPRGGSEGTPFSYYTTCAPRCARKAE
ncbi:hypothetical protein MishRS11D_36090 [Methylomagnum ishizawai]|nr:hypothetical protein MishRS11D_36090 [Methylomagnum ishizawai]